MPASYLPASIAGCEQVLRGSRLGHPFNQPAGSVTKDGIGSCREAWRLSNACLDAHPASLIVLARVKPGSSESCYAPRNTSACQISCALCMPATPTKPSADANESASVRSRGRALGTMTPALNGRRPGPGSVRAVKERLAPDRSCGTTSGVTHLYNQAQRPPEWPSRIHRCPGQLAAHYRIRYGRTVYQPEAGPCAEGSA